jgi:hypothetical protein
MSPEKGPIKEPISDYPYKCPECKTDLGQPGSVIAWTYYPERTAGHIEAGEYESNDNKKESVKFAVDKLGSEHQQELQCADCSHILDKLVVEEMFLDPECEDDEED